jgi:hypothetical protein
VDYSYPNYVLEITRPTFGDIIPAQTDWKYQNATRTRVCWRIRFWVWVSSLRIR